MQHYNSRRAEPLRDLLPQARELLVLGLDAELQPLDALGGGGELVAIHAQPPVVSTGALDTDVPFPGSVLFQPGVGQTLEEMVGLLAALERSGAWRRGAKSVG